MADETYHPRGSHPAPSGGSGSVSLFGSIDYPGYAEGDIAIVDGGTLYRWSGTAWVAD